MFHIENRSNHVFNYNLSLKFKIYSCFVRVSKNVINERIALKEKN